MTIPSFSQSETKSTLPVHLDETKTNLKIVIDQEDT